MSGQTKSPKTRTRTSSSSPVGVANAKSVILEMCLDVKSISVVSIFSKMLYLRSDKSVSFVLAGVFRGGHDALVRSRLALADGVTMQVTVRSSEETVVDIILASVG